jgi:glycosyltransferase involved in cell wall biosynthesis
MARTKLNILFLNSIETTVWGGLENWMELTGRGLARRGHKVWFAGRDGSQFLKRVSAIPDIETVPLEISGDFNPVTIGQMAGIVRDRKIDLTLCNFVKDVRLMGMAHKFTGGNKIVWTPGVNLAKKSFSHKWMFSDFVDQVLVPSKYLRDEIAASGYIEQSRFEVIPIGIDDSIWQGNKEKGREFLRKRYNLPDKAFVCLTSGRFVKQKGHVYLVEAARVLVRDYDNMFFLLLGDGPLQAKLQEQIKNYDLADRFVFCGLLENHQRAVFGADLYIHPAIIEPYGIVLVEAMAASLPIVATRVGGIPEVVAEDETALLVDAANPEQLTKGIERFYNDLSLRDKFGRAGYERFDRLFRMETMIDKIEQTLIEVASA